MAPRPPCPLTQYSHFHLASSHLVCLFLLFSSSDGFSNSSYSSYSDEEYSVTTFLTSSSPHSIAMSRFNGMVYITEVGTNDIRIVNRTSLSSELYGMNIANLRDICLSNTSPQWGLVTSMSGIIYKMNLEAKTFDIFVGQSASGMSNGYGTHAQFRNPWTISLSPNDSYALVADTENNLIRKITMANAFVETFAGGESGAANGAGTNAKFNRPRGVAISPDGTFALVCNRNSHIINKIILSTAEVSIFAGTASGYSNGFGTNAQFSFPSRLVISASGDFVIVADSGANRIRLIYMSTSEVINIAGSGTAGNTSGLATNARFNFPIGVAISSMIDGSYVLVADYSNSLIRKITRNYSPTTSPTSSQQLHHFSFAVKVGNGGVLSSDKAILIHHLQDLRSGESCRLCHLS